jgi:streptogramin lyase
MVSTAKKYEYKVEAGWGKLPAAWTWGVISAVACDSQDRVYVYTRGEHPLLIFDQEGHFLDSWGESVVKMAHGIYIDHADNVFCTDRGAHCVYQFDHSGSLVMTLGAPGKPGEEGEPFNMPTDVTVGPTGALFISDGYGNRRIHQFSPEGRRLLSWGMQGDGPGQFALPHSVRVDKHGRVWVCDRENHRIQIFDNAGRFLNEWTGLRRPDTLFFDKTEDVVYIAELDYQVSIYTLEGGLISCWGGGQSSDQPGQFLGWPHGIWADSTGDLYVCEVNTEGRLQKFKKTVV